MTALSDITCDFCGVPVDSLNAGKACTNAPADRYNGVHLFRKPQAPQETASEAPRSDSQPQDPQ